MAVEDPNTPQVVNPERVVDLTRLLQIRGPLGVLNVLDTIVPTVSMGDVVTRNVTVLQPSFRSTDVFTEQLLVNAPANTVHADTGALSAGVYDIQLHISANTTNALAWRIEHRNAANTADLALWQVLAFATVTPVLQQGLSYEFGVNERLRIVNASVIGAGVATVAWIFARLRS